ncbi:hypothetical protein [Pontibacter oryzae]|uniref:Uncharacterized protein n=1 Tax=Pontibacter oryzae TaxID=2304593 RepID=A0A399S4U3_9BACT|nr:hypothetical protein [Pontibacter oryzae]RIJ37423.1 hypothetical protein D1627_09860 [Pontibacter oryzae]
MQIDSTRYDEIKTKYGYFDVRKAPDYLGGLKPTHSFAYTFALCDKSEYCHDSKWANKGMMCGCKNIVIEDSVEFKFISSRSQFKEIFAPVETREEALSYAIVMSGYYPVFNKSYFKDGYRYFNSKPRTTVVQEVDGYYLVQLFDYKAFGCGEHPYYTVVVRVDKSGEVSEHRRQKSFADPEEDGLCRD